MKNRIILLAAAGLIWLTGCIKEPMERIALEQTSPVITIEMSKPEAEIILEQETAPSEAAEETGQEQQEPLSFRLLFSGDVLFSDHVLNAYEKGGGIGGVLDDGYRKLIDEADFFFVNEEFPFSDRGTKAPDKQYTFRLPPSKVSMLQEMSVDAVSLANNHALDFGTDALLDTCDTLDAVGILHTGAGKNLEEAKKAVEIEIQGKKVAMIGATRVIPVAEWATYGNTPGMLAAYDPKILLSEVERLAETQDYVIVFIHWGIERAEHPESYQRELGKRLIDAGADMVIGAHPHVLQGIEYYQGKPIVYSLGNFVFGSSIPKTMLLEVQMEGEHDPVLVVHPGTSSGGYTRMLTDEQEKQAFDAYLTSISYGVTIEDGLVSAQP